MVREWTARAQRGDHDAAAHLCQLYFDDRSGTLDPDKTVTWCRKATAAGDADAMRQMGLLTLAGIGVSKDLDAATTLCTAAHARNHGISAAFCLAAVTAERQRAEAADGPLVLPPAARVPTDPELGAEIAHWTTLSNHGDHVAPARMCDIYFDAREGVFDAVKTADWCRRAAEFGDARATRRLGLIHLWGVGLEKSSPEAEALCIEAQKRDPTVSAAFCVAAVTEERARTAEDATLSHFAYPQPWPAASDSAQFTDALGPDRVIESVHTTPTGLRYTCRELSRWARYGLPVGGVMFGRSVSEYTTADYSALDKAATECANAIAPYDEDGSERQQLAEFRKRLPLLEQRKRDLLQAAAEQRAENARQATENHDLLKQHMVMVAALSPAEERCTNAIYLVWVARDPIHWADTLEITSVETTEEHGNTVVRGAARIVDQPPHTGISDNVYSCTFEGHSQTITARALAPATGP
jgi:TPR repeat protein